MAGNSIVRRVDGIGERSVSAALSGFLAMTSDAALAFDAAGKILLSNEVADALLFVAGESLVGESVLALFSVDDLRSLPFFLDGQVSRVSLSRADGSLLELTFRCDLIASAGETYLLLAHETHMDQAARSERDRLVEELSRANRRLSGTLGIVLDTLDSSDVGVLFERVLEEITQTMEASGTVFYMAERDGYHLRGTSSSLGGARVPRFVPLGGTIDALAIRAGRALRARVLPPEGQDLRQGRLSWRSVVDEGTQEVHRVRASVLPPFASFVVVPIWFGGHVIALMEVGWEQLHPTRREDSELLDAVAQYLSVQLAGAFSTLRSRKEHHLANVASSLREALMGQDGADASHFEEMLSRVCQELEVIPGVFRRSSRGSSQLELELGGRTFDLPAALLPASVEEDGPESVVQPVTERPELSGWLRERNVPDAGVYLDLGMLQGARRRCLLLRAEDAEPLDDLELAFLREVVRDVRELSLGQEARRQDQRISQALQTGMRNELQKVPGISAEGIYSSATATAVIGGDFYDLIRLPRQRACVIMGDVSGKGVEAASVSAAVKTALGAYSWQGLSPARMVRLLNDFLLGFSRMETFATLFVGVVDLGTATLSYCSAGHPPAILVRASTGEIEALDVQSGVVGAFHEMSYRNGRVRLSEGDMLLLYTDGTTEARAQDGSFFGEDGLRDAVMSQAPRGFDGLLDRMLGVLDGFTGRSLEDDVAMVCLRFDALGAADAPACD